MSLLTRLARTLGISGSGRRDHHAPGRRVGRVPPAELSVVEAALTRGGPIADRVVRQFQQAPHVWRLIGEGGAYELQISTIDPLAIRDVPRAGWMSAWIPVTAMPGDRPVELRISILGAGIAMLLGQTRDGAPWPKTWTARAEDLARIRDQAPWLQLPTPEDLRRSRASASRVIGAWLGQPGALRGRRGLVRAEPPASQIEISAFEERERFQLPPSYRELLLAADGIEVGDATVLGTRDAYRLDIPGPDRLVVSPPTEDGALTLAPGGEVIWVDIDDETSEGRVLATDLREWLS